MVGLVADSPAPGISGRARRARLNALRVSLPIPGAASHRRQATQPQSLSKRRSPCPQAQAALASQASQRGWLKTLYRFCSAM